MKPESILSHLDELDELDEAVARKGEEASYDGSVNSKEMLRAVLNEFGGYSGVARLLKLDFDRNDVGSPHRIGVEKDIIRGILSRGEEDDAAGPTEEDLQALERQLRTAEG